MQLKGVVVFPFVSLMQIVLHYVSQTPSVSKTTHHQTQESREEFLIRGKPASLQSGLSFFK